MIWEEEVEGQEAEDQALVEEKEVEGQEVEAQQEKPCSFQVEASKVE